MVEAWVGDESQDTPYQILTTKAPLALNQLLSTNYRLNYKDISYMDYHNITAVLLDIIDTKNKKKIIARKLKIINDAN